MEVFVILKGLRGEIVVRYAATRTIDHDLAHRVPRFFMGCHDRKPVEFRGDDALRLLRSIVPKLKIAAQVLAPVRRHIVKKIQHTVHFPILS